MTKTLGIDLSSQDADTATCIINWSDGHATVTEPILERSDDAKLLEQIGRVDKVGIDVPLGWPRSFVDAVNGYSHLDLWPKQYLHSDNPAYRYRTTDLWVEALWASKGVKKWPLSVSTDRIALPAMRAAALLSKLPPVPRDGSLKIVEVYPAAALRSWGFKYEGYKGPEHRAERETLVNEFLQQTWWLTVPDVEAERCRQNDDAFDALIAALVARATLCELTHEIPEEHADVALHEGWIAVPREGSLMKLHHDHQPPDPQ